MKTTILEKIFTVFCLLNKMTMLLLFLKNFIAATVLRTILVNFCRHFQIDDVEK